MAASKTAPTPQDSNANAHLYTPCTNRFLSLSVMTASSKNWACNPNLDQSSVGGTNKKDSMGRSGYLRAKSRLTSKACLRVQRKRMTLRSETKAAATQTTKANLEVGVFEGEG